MLIAILCICALICGIGIGMVIQGLRFDGDRIGYIVVDDDLVYLAFNKGYGPESLKNRHEVSMKVVSHK